MGEIFNNIRNFLYNNSGRLTLAALGAYIAFPDVIVYPIYRFIGPETKIDIGNVKKDLEKLSE